MTGRNVCEQDGTSGGGDDAIMGFQQTLSFPVDDCLNIDALQAFRDAGCQLEFTLEADDLVERNPIGGCNEAMDAAGSYRSHAWRGSTGRSPSRT